MDASACSVCNKTSTEANIKQCAKCHETLYCSRECQKADWKVHKKICGKSGQDFAAETPVLSPPKGLDCGVADPFTRLDSHTWLYQDRSKTDVYRLLLDAYRLSVEDSYALEGVIERDSLYDGNQSGIRGFRRFLSAAERRGTCLPPWWSPAERRACEKMGMDNSVWQNLQSAVEKSDIIEHYGDRRFPMQLRMFTESVMGRGPAGQDGTAMRKMMVQMEKNPGTSSMLTLDMSSLSMRG